MRTTSLNCKWNLPWSAISTRRKEYNCLHRNSFIMSREIVKVKWDICFFIYVFNIYFVSPRKVLKKVFGGPHWAWLAYVIAFHTGTDYSGNVWPWKNAWRRHGECFEMLCITLFVSFCVYMWSAESIQLSGGLRCPVDMVLVRSGHPWCSVTDHWLIMSSLRQVSFRHCMKYLSHSDSVKKVKNFNFHF